MKVLSRHQRFGGKRGYYLQDIPLANFFGPAIPGREWQQGLLMHMLTVNVDNFVDEADDPRDLNKQGQRYAEARLVRRPGELPERRTSPARSSLMSSTRRPSQELEEGEIEEISADVSGDLQLQLFSNLNNTLKEFNENLSKNSSGKFNIKREYKLTKSTQFNIWFDHLTSELKSRDLLDVIDANIEPSKRYTYREMSRRKLWVRDIIINHLDEHYHRKILGIDDPIKIIRNIRDTRRAERNVTESSVRAYLYRIKIDPRERISNFIDRFDNIVREYHSFEGVIRLSTEEIRSAFYNAVAGSSPELRQAALTLGSKGNEPMTMDEMRILLLQLEAERKTDPRRDDTRRPDTREVESTPYDPTVYASTPYRPRRGNEDRCNRCNLDGHHARQCPLIALGQWFCYVCRRNATHIGAECPLKHRVDNKSVYPKTSTSIPHSRGKPHKSRRASWSKGKGRGSGNTRGRDRGTGQVTKNRSNVETPGRTKKLAARAAEKSTELEVSFPMEIYHEDRDEINSPKGAQEELTGANTQNSSKRKLAEKPQTTLNKQPRLNPERKAKTNRPTWGHLRRTQADESVEEPGLTAPEILYLLTDGRQMR
ncbi:hypothetical protein QAD02_007210 [Eretmocerus hayati]|uniref:Uncharacterized protein n=1 Tax=Eretmocerus hayati TaxID=131215 RepID=A0ACC2N3K8_9HYME|nr:hypothetical protein QAD02_007210 [Eretmocerus hayati]